MSHSPKCGAMGWLLTICCMAFGVDVQLHMSVCLHVCVRYEERENITSYRNKFLTRLYNEVI